MNMIVFSTLAGAPLAMLGLSTPVTSHRDCIFMVHPQIKVETFKGREGQVVLPDRPTEYSCSYAKTKNGTTIEFKNQNGWRFVVRIGARDEGTWSASKDAESIHGVAVAPFRD